MKNHTEQSHEIPRNSDDIPLDQGLVNVLIEHHPTIGDINSNKYLKVIFKIPKKGHLPTPVNCHSSHRLANTSALRLMFIIARFGDAKTPPIRRPAAWHQPHWDRTVVKIRLVASTNKQKRI